MKRFRSRARFLRRTISRRFSDWDSAFGLDTEDQFFSGWESMPSFQFGKGGFRVSDAWWLAELCRTAYTPDQKEIDRRRSIGLPRREEFLSDRSSFEEVFSLHKTANHVSLYRDASNPGGTIICFRGTKRTRQWMMNLLVRPHGWQRFRREGDPEDAFLHSGFYVLFKRIRPHLFPILEGLPRPWIFTGHSLGGALATITAIVAKGDLLCTFGAPKIGNAAFHQVGGLPETWRFVNDNDIVPRLPLPDERNGDRVFAHSCPALRLKGNEIRPFSDPHDEDQLPFDPRAIVDEFHSPPSWFRDHRMGGYCAKLRKIIESESA